MAWEVFVSHSLEENKTDYFTSNGIPFLELFPENFSISSEFNLNNYGNIESLLISNNHFEQIIRLKEDYIYERFKDRIEDQKIDKAVKVEVKKIVDSSKRQSSKNTIDAIREAIIESNLLVSQEISKYFRSEIKTSRRSFIKFEPYCNTIKNPSKIISIGFKHFVRLDENYSFESEYIALANLLRYLIENNYCSALVNRNEIIGLSVVSPNIKNDGDPHRLELIFDGGINKGYHKQNISNCLCDHDYGKSYNVKLKTDFGICTKIIDVAQPLCLVINYLIENYRVNFAADDKGRIFTLKIDGLPMEKMLREKITSLLRKNLTKNALPFT